MATRSWSSGRADRGRWLLRATPVVLGAWTLRRLWGDRPPAGLDITGHLARLRVGVRDVVSTGHLDGWYAGAMLGYQAFLLYGPGLTIMVALLRLLTLGTLSDTGALKVLAVLAYLAVPPAMAYLARGLGLRRA